MSNKNIKIIEPQRKEILSAYKPKTRVCAYCRVSTDSNKQHSSYLAQAEYYKNYIEQRKEWELVGIYADESSGTKLKNRDGFNKMISECEKNNIDLIITKSITRFARNTIDSIETIRKLKELGIAVYFEKENINTMSEQSEQMLTILSSIAQGESESISTNVRWGIEKRFRDGTYIPSCVAYGYIKNDDGELEIEPQQAEIIRRIFTEYLNGKGTYLIAKGLNDDNIRPIRKAKIWRDNVIQDILKNQIYKGDMLLQKTYTTQNLPFTKKKNKGEKAQYLVQNNHQPIISQEDFDKIQEIMSYRSKKTIANNYEFSGKIKCSECGDSFRRQKIYIGTPYEAVQWCCKTHIADKNKCKQKAIREDSLKQSFVNMWNRLVSNYEYILTPLLDSLEQLNLQDNKVQLETIENQIKDINEQSRILSEVAQKGYIDSDLYIFEQTRLNIEIERLKREKDIILSKSEYKYEIQQTKKIIRVMETNYKLIDSYEKSLFISLVKQIYISDKEIIFELKNKLKLTERR